MCKRMVATALAIAVLGSNGLAFAQQCPATVPAQGAPIAAPLPVFPSDNWWNTDISAAPVDAKSASFISFIGATRTLHPDFGGEESPGSTAIYGFPYAVVDGSQPKQAVSFLYWDESDGVDMNSGNGIPFYPIPSQAISQAHWVESGSPASVDERDSNDRHLLMVDCTNRTLYELYNVWYSNAEHRWYAGSGAFYDMTRNDRRPEGWTSADAAGLAIFPGLVRYDEAANSAVAEINHAFRVTVRTSNGHVYPASHTAGSTAGALPMGARLRLKKLVNGVDPATRTTDPTARKIFRAMQKYGLIVADNGSDMYISGTFDVRWNNGTLNPAFSALSASDFEVVQLGWRPAVAPPQLFVDDASIRKAPRARRPWRSPCASPQPRRRMSPLPSPHRTSPPPQAVITSPPRARSRSPRARPRARSRSRSMATARARPAKPSGSRCPTRPTPRWATPRRSARSSTMTCAPAASSHRPPWRFRPALSLSRRRS